MTESKLRIPRVALAVLVLGAGCGDDEKSSDEGENGDDGGHHAGHDAGDDGEHDAGDGHQEHDAGAGDELDGGGHTEHDAANGQDGGDDAVNVSAARIQRVADDFCGQGFRCEEEEVVDNFDDPAACVADSVMYWESYIETLGEECIDSQLDLYACAALLTCDEDIEHACHAQLEKTAELCASDG
jgi:hypothetical protein